VPHACPQRALRIKQAAASSSSLIDQNQAMDATRDSGDTDPSICR
jgi:hypothetical protein